MYSENLLYNEKGFSMKIINKNLIAFVLVVLIAFTSLYMTGCDKEDVVATPDNVPASVATVDETASVTEITTEATTQNTTASESTTSITTTEVTVGETVDNSSTGNSSDNKPADKVIVTEGNTSSQHIHSYGWVTKKASCTSDGYTEYSCACGAVYTDNYIEAYGHDWSAWETVKEATTESVGKRQKVCSTCGKVKSESIDKVESPYDASYNSNITLLRERILYYINNYRSVSATSLTKMTEYSDYRAWQLVDNFKHDLYDINNAATALEYGKKFENGTYNPETGEIINDGTFSYNPGHCHEAIYKSTNCGGSIDEVAKKVADKIYSSSSHWSYIGASENVYISVGVYIAEPTLYVCVTASEYNAIDYE